MWLKPLLVPIAVFLDDRLGYGMRNPYKKWWLDLEMVDGVCVHPKGVNERDIDYHRKLDTSTEKIVYYHAGMMPPPDQGNEPYPVDRQAARAAVSLVETPQQARARKAAGGAKPLHYIPTPPLKQENETID